MGQLKQAPVDRDAPVPKLKHRNHELHDHVLQEGPRCQAYPVPQGPSKATRRPVAMAGMQVLKPEKRYECLSYLPPLSDDEISRQIDYLVGNGWAPCIEFASQEEADTNQLFFAGPALYENRYWTMWKLPMFGCQSGDE